ncbi:MAG: hypothetical protein FJ206_15360 [Gemmatimonadetes bacterium]|nr:hypothetical protein [Gemmatimonadota bacterium]
MTVAALGLAAVALAAVVYLWLEPQGRAGLVPLALRAAAWLSLGTLAVDLSCAHVVGAERPLALLDGSLSMGAAGADWPGATIRANQLGEVQFLGKLGPDSTPVGGSSGFAAAVAGAVSRGRPVWLVTDGELEDAGELAGDWWSAVGVSVVPRTPVPDLAVTRVGGPDRVSVGDTLRIEVDVAGFGMADRSKATVEVTSGSTRWLERGIPLSAGSGTAALDIPIPAAFGAGDHLLMVRLTDAADQAPDTDSRYHLVRVLPTPGVVLLASPANWESRFLYRALLDVGAVPIRGYLTVERDRWSRMGDLAPASGSEVEQAVARADVLVLAGEVANRFRSARPKGRWEVAPSAGAVEGDWYLAPSAISPIVGAFVGLPVDSFPPAVALAAVGLGPRHWVGLMAQQNRRGVERPAIVGRDSAGRREVVVAAGGLWRWAFRGGASEQAYRAYVASTLTWLLGASDSTTGVARPIRAVVERGRPVVFERLRGDSGVVTIELAASGAPARVDTLSFDGAGRASLALEPGQFRYRLGGGGSGLIAVERYSRELLPRPVVVSDREAQVRASTERAPLRDRWWLFAIAVAALAGEWFWRRRAGLR